MQERADRLVPEGDVGAILQGEEEPADMDVSLARWAIQESVPLNDIQSLQPSHRGGQEPTVFFVPSQLSLLVTPNASGNGSIVAGSSFPVQVRDVPLACRVITCLPISIQRSRAHLSHRSQPQVVALDRHGRRVARYARQPQIKASFIVVTAPGGRRPPAQPSDDEMPSPSPVTSLFGSTRTTIQLFAVRVQPNVRSGQHR